MKQLNGYAQAQAYSDSERLPVGGYVLKIMDVKYQENEWGDVIILSFDIEEGEQKGFLLQTTRPRQEKINGGKVHTGFGCQKMMAVSRMSGQCAGLKLLLQHLKNLMPDITGIGMSRHLKAR